MILSGSLVHRPPSLILGDVGEPARRVTTNIQRIIRDTALGREVKRLHAYRCQIAGRGWSAPAVLMRRLRIFGRLDPLTTVLMTSETCYASAPIIMFSSTMEHLGSPAHWSL